MLIDHPDYLATVNQDRCPCCGVYPGQYLRPDCNRNKTDDKEEEQE